MLLLKTPKLSADCADYTDSKDILSRVTGKTMRKARIGYWSNSVSSEICAICVICGYILNLG
jgi:hypothetical protein